MIVLRTWVCSLLDGAIAARVRSRSLREGAACQEEAEKVRGELALAERSAQTAKAQADAAERNGQMSRAVFERAGAADPDTLGGRSSMTQPYWRAAGCQGSLRPHR